MVEFGWILPDAPAVMVNAVVADLAPGVTTVGLKAAVWPAGTPDTVKETGWANPLALGATVIWTIAGCAAVRDACEGPLTV